LPYLDDENGIAIDYLHNSATDRKRISDISCIAPKLSPVRPPNLAAKMYFRIRHAR
jgi:hypothetical protein